MFVPVDADPLVLTRLEGLGAHVVVCPRNGTAGRSDLPPALAGARRGRFPFTCQGNLNGLAVEGGETLGWELVSSGVASTGWSSRSVEAHSRARASRRCRRRGELGAIDRMPRLDTVQTEGAWPLKRAFDAVGSRGEAMRALRFASTHRSEFMWPWEEEPTSVAHGILDDETYDWLVGQEAIHLVEEDRPRRLVVGAGGGCGCPGRRAGNRGSSRRGRGRGRRDAPVARECSRSVGHRTRVASLGDVDLGERLEEAHGVLAEVVRRCSSLNSSHCSRRAVGEEHRREHLAERRVVTAPPDAGDLEVERRLAALVVGGGAHPSAAVGAAQDQR